jgi:hypothetical protein
VEPAGPVCKWCGRHHPLGRFLLGCPGPRRKRLNAEQPIDEDAAVMASLSDYRYDVLCRVFAAYEQQTLKFAEGMQAKGRASESELKALRDHADGLRIYHADLRAMESSMTQEQLWARVARVFSRRAEEFVELVCDVLRQHPEFALTLRAALAEHDGKAQPEPEAVPPEVMPDGVPRPVFDEPDEVTL